VQVVIVVRAVDDKLIPVAEQDPGKILCPNFEDDTTKSKQPSAVQSTADMLKPDREVDVESSKSVRVDVKEPSPDDDCV
jgi:hypothetical protein